MAVEMWKQLPRIIAVATLWSVHSPLWSVFSLLWSAYSSLWSIYRMPICCEMIGYHFFHSSSSIWDWRWLSVIFHEWYNIISSNFSFHINWLPVPVDETVEPEVPPEVIDWLILIAYLFETGPSRPGMFIIWVWFWLVRFMIWGWFWIVDGIVIWLIPWPGLISTNRKPCWTGSHICLNCDWASGWIKTSYDLYTFSYCSSLHSASPSLIGQWGFEVSNLKTGLRGFSYSDTRSISWFYRGS